MADDTKDMKNAENAPMGKTSSHNIKVYLDNCAYTKWQRQHFDAKTPEQIRAEAERYVTEHPYTGDPSTVI